MKSSQDKYRNHPIKVGLLLLFPLAIIITACPPGVNPFSGTSVTAISISNATDTYTISTAGGTLQLTAAVTPTDATDKTVTWSVSTGSTYATVSSTGLVTAVANGTATIKALANDGSEKCATKDIIISGQNSVVDQTPSVAAPTASVAAGNIVIGRQITLSTTTNETIIRYTLDGTEPSAASTTYAVDTPIEIVDESIILKAKAFKDGMSDSDTSTFAYTLVNGFTVTTDGLRRSISEGVPGTVVAPLDMRAYGPLFGESGDRSVTIIACMDSLLFGTVGDPYLMITITYDYSATYSTYQSLLQIGIPYTELTELPKTFMLGTDQIQTALTVGGFTINPEQLSVESTFTITSLGEVGEPIIGNFSFMGEYDNSEPFESTGIFRAIRGGNVPMTLGTSGTPQMLCAGLSLGSNATNGSTSYYRIPVADCNYSVFVMANGGMGGGIPDTSIIINSAGISNETYSIDSSGSGTNDLWAGAIHETDGYFDFHITDDMTSDVAGAAYMIMLTETYTDTPAFLARYIDVSSFTLANVGDGTDGTYTSNEIDRMLGYNRNYITSAQGISSGDEILYGLSDATGEYIFAVHRSSTGDSWSVSTITEGVYNFMADQDPYNIP